MTVSEVGLGPDPDPTPTATPWQEYLAAAQSLDAVVRESAAEAAATSRATGQARAELARLRDQLSQQRARVVGEAVRARLPAPQLVPSPAEQAAVHARLAGDPAAAVEALRRCTHLLQRADAELADILPARPVPNRAALYPVSRVQGSPPQQRAGVPAGRSSWSTPVWLMVVAPLGTAILAVFTIAIVLAIAR